MNQLAPPSSPTVPALVAAAGESISMRLLEFFAANIRNPHAAGLLSGGRRIPNLVREYRGCR